MKFRLQAAETIWPTPNEWGQVIGFAIFQVLAGAVVGFAFGNTGRGALVAFEWWIGTFAFVGLPVRQLVVRHTTRKNASRPKPVCDVCLAEGRRFHVMVCDEHANQLAGHVESMRMERLREQPFRVHYDAPWPMTAGEVRALDELIEAGKVAQGARVTPDELHRLIGCTHQERPCPACLRLD